ncbi:hypothetical protein GYMLUDRAFT_250352 [Collybiopsis luxurians FD-317 M1]|uniref:Uncharacterized protein n=1 Tax=Collybiopsis luxurians FD-317 M1 TaxID=944289 RepID=A0A0D0BVA7_9AGAR|nr:hypothetical protein GYMLUDRAFT_250352 [Collybiopsis luxurians FD-317 M1]
MSSSQTFPNQPIASSSASGGSKPRLIIKILQSLQSASMVPFSNALPSAPPAAKKMQCVAFECSTRLSYPSISITDRIPPSLPISLQPIYEDTYLANLSPEVLDRVDVKEWRNIFRNYPSCEYCESHNLCSSCSLCPDSLSCSTCEVNYPSGKKFCSFKSIFHLLQFHILAKLPLIVAYRIVSSRGLFDIQGEEWNALMTGLQKIPYYCNHPEELSLSSDRPRVSEGKRKAVVSSNAFRKSQLLQQEGICLGELSREQVVLNLYRKGKEVVCDAADVDVEMGAPEELDTMTLDYPEDVPPPPVPVPTPSAPVWKASNNQSYCEVSGLKTWFFEPLIKQVPSDGSSLTRDKMIQTAIEHVVTRMALLFAGAFADLKEQLQHSPSEPPAPFSSESLLRFVESLTVVNMTSANIVDSQQDELLQAYREYQALLPKSDHLETENLHLKEQVSSQESQLEEKDEELACLKSFVRHFKGDVQSSEVQQLRGALEAQDGEIEELKKKLAASEEARRVTAEESKSRDDELSQLQQLFESVQGQFAAASPTKPSSSSS